MFARIDIFKISQHKQSQVYDRSSPRPLSKSSYPTLVCRMNCLVAIFIVIYGKFKQKKHETRFPFCHIFCYKTYLESDIFYK